MTVQCVGFIPAAPLLIPDLAGEAVDRDADLREAVRGVVRDVVARQTATGARLVVMGAATTTGDVHGTWDFRRLGVGRGGDGAIAATPLPTSLAIAAWFLDEVSPDVERDYLGVANAESTARCMELGRRLSEECVLLVVGDGSACHGDKAPGREDPRANDIDGTVATAIAAGDPSALLGLDAAMCRELLVEGRAPWQVAAAAGAARSWHGDRRLDIHPYGVGYLVGLWSPEGLA